MIQLLRFTVDEMGKRLDDMEAAINTGNDVGASGHGAD